MKKDWISVVVVDDHPLFREGVVKTLSLDPMIKIVGEASHGQEGLVLIRNLKPKVAVVDINMPGINGQQLAQKVMREKLRTRIVLVTAYDDDTQRVQAIKAGGAAYCSKDVEPEKLIKVVRLVSQGLYVIGEEELDQAGAEKWLSQHSDSLLRAYSDPGEPYQPLSDREMEVLLQIAEGLSNKQIALILGISNQTVKNHVTAILRKLGVEDRTQAALYALRRGWIRLSEDSVTEE